MRQSSARSRCLIQRNFGQLKSIFPQGMTVVVFVHFAIVVNAINYFRMYKKPANFFEIG
jgi:hypothetical protein